MKAHAQQSIWPVSVFGLGFMLLIMGLTGVASIQETHRIHLQILAVEDNYRHIEKMVEGIRTDTLNADLLRRDRLLDSNRDGDVYASQLAGLRTMSEADLETLRAFRPQQESKVLERLDAALRDYWKAVGLEFQASQAPLHQRTASARDQFASRSKKIFTVTEEIGKLNEENFEARRRELSLAVENLQNDIWKSIWTALCLGAIIAGASIFRISSLEKESAEYQDATKQAEKRLRQLSQQLVSSQEQERKSLSRELHDEIGQLLTALRMELGNLERTRPATQTGEADAHLDQAKKLAETTLKTTRGIAMGLRPAMLDLLGLGPALEWQTREFSRRYSTPIQLEVGGDLKDLPDRHRTYLYRIVQEGLTNCARHAKAKNIRVQVEEANGQVAVTVADDGVGFDPHGSVVQGLGLLGITERVRELCGKISIDSEPGKGTRIAVVLPLNQNDGAAPSEAAAATE